MDSAARRGDITAKISPSAAALEALRASRLQLLIASHRSARTAKRSGVRS
jgi:hypothetical protein